MKVSDPNYIAKTVIIAFQSLAISSIIKIAILQAYGLDYIAELKGNDIMRLIYLLPAIPCAVITHFLYTKKKVEYLIRKMSKYPNIKLNIYLIFSIGVNIFLVFSYSILKLLIK